MVLMITKPHRYILRLVARRGRGEFLPTSRCNSSRLSRIFHEE